MIKIFIADDHAILRQGLVKMFQEEHDIQVVGEAADGFEVLEKIHELEPDILLVDLVMPRLNGLEVTNRLKKERPELKIVVLSMRKSEPYILEALRNGADGYVLKSEDPKILIEAIHTVANGEHFLSPRVANFALDSYLLKSQQIKPDAYDQLTNREREILQLSAEGMSNEEIAEYLTLSIHTVSTHRRNLMSKLNLRNQTELMRFALNRGIINSDI